MAASGYASRQNRHLIQIGLGNIQQVSFFFLVNMSIAHVIFVHIQAIAEKA